MINNSLSEKFLPLGTVVLLKGGTKRLMITGYCITPKNNVSTMYDYSGCIYPEGMVFGNKVALFNHDQIEKIVYLGPSDEELNKFISVLKESLLNPGLKKSIDEEVLKTQIFEN